MEVAALAALAGNTLVTAAVTDAWEDVRHKVARLFGRGKSDPKIEQKLDDTRRQLDAARPTGELERVQADLARDWAVRLKDLLADYPDAETELAALVEEIKPAIAAAADHSVAAGRDVNVSADHGSVAGGVIDGDVTMQGPSSPGPAGG
jgi:hypothetical protein